MNNVDSQYLSLLKEIIDYGEWKDTRSGVVKSVFGKTIRIKLKEGLPILTTKKMYSKGVIHELLWFISGGTNIKYLVDNDTHIWDDDAYRYYTDYVINASKYSKILINDNEILINYYNGNGWIKCGMSELPENEDDFIKIIKSSVKPPKINIFGFEYTFGDLGPIYGAQWRHWNGGTDQIKQLIDELKVNPDSRRLIVTFLLL